MGMPIGTTGVVQQITVSADEARRQRIAAAIQDPNNHAAHYALSRRLGELLADPATHDATANAIGAAMAKGSGMQNHDAAACAQYFADAKAGTLPKVPQQPVDHPTPIQPTQPTTPVAHQHGTTHGTAGHEMTLWDRPAPENPALAAQNLNAIIDATARFQDPKVADAEGYKIQMLSKNGIYHYQNTSIPEDAPLDLAHPRRLMYRFNDDGTRTLVGAVYHLTPEEGMSAPDFGMGQWHSHKFEAVQMKHVWFVSNIKEAFADQASKALVDGAAPRTS